MRLLHGMQLVLSSLVIQFSSLSHATSVTSICSPVSISPEVGARGGWVCKPDHREPATSLAPLIIAFHGRNFDPPPPGAGVDGFPADLKYRVAGKFATSVLLHEIWPEAVVIYLQGLQGGGIDWEEVDQSANPKFGWQTTLTESGGRDINFVAQVINAAIPYYSIDPQRIYATGHSNGARMIGVLWKASSFYPNGTPFAGFAFSAAQADDLMQGASQRSVFMSMGVQDTTVDFATLQLPSIGYARALLGLPGQSWSPGLNSQFNQAGLELMTYIHPYGHDWPRPGSSYPGLVVDQSQLIVDFFKRHHR